MKELSTNCLKIKWRRDIYNRKQIIKENNTNIVECVWGLGMGIGDWGLGPIPNPQSPIPNPQSPNKISYQTINNLYNCLNYVCIY